MSTECRICLSTNLVTFLDFGEVPLAGGFIEEDDPNDIRFPLSVAFCKDCKGVQVAEEVPANVLYKDYRYFSSDTPLTEHFNRYARIMKDRFSLGKSSTVVEFGSNDGVLQEPFGDLGVKVIGVEPATNVANVARRKGFTVINDYFTQGVSHRIYDEVGCADLICANNVFAHIGSIRDTTEAVSFLLKEKGVFVFEVHYLLDLLEDLQYDNIYHEHIMYHSVIALKNLLEFYNMTIFDVERIPTHAGSIRVYAQRTPHHWRRHHFIKESAYRIIELERQKGLDKEETFFEFANKINDRKESLSNTVKALVAKGKRVAGYGAGGRTTMQLNFCKLDIDYVIDASEEKQGRLIPGVRIPIVSPDILKQDSPDYLIIFAYNYVKEIMEKEKDYNGNYIIPLPEVKVI